MLEEHIASIFRLFILEDGESNSFKTSLNLHLTAWYHSSHCENVKPNNERIVFNDRFLCFMDRKEVVINMAGNWDICHLPSSTVLHFEEAVSNADIITVFPSQNLC